MSCFPGWLVAVVQIGLPKDTHPHKAGDASGYALLWEEMDRAF